MSDENRPKNADDEPATITPIEGATLRLTALDYAVKYDQNTGDRPAEAVVKRAGVYFDYLVGKVK